MASSRPYYSVMKLSSLLCGLVAVLGVSLPLRLLAATELVPVATGPLSKPVFVANARDGSNRLFIVEQGGAIKVLAPGSTVASIFLDIGDLVRDDGESGLLGLAFHPRFQDNGRFFVYYTRKPNGVLTLAEYHVTPQSPNVASGPEAVLLSIEHPNGNHNGGTLAFGRDDYLYLAVGDGGGDNDVANNAQNMNALLGKILRIDVDHADAARGLPYSSPTDNPFFGATFVRDEIWSLGWRNPFRFSFDRQTGAMWVADVGQFAREEVNAPIVRSGNYGWRPIEGTLCTQNDPALCNATHYIAPLFEYGHDGGRCSVTGGYVYRGSKGTLPSGTYLFGDYCTGEIFKWDGVAQSVLFDTTMLITGFGEDEAGEIYVIDQKGAVRKIREAPMVTATLDIDGSGTSTQYDALTDGMLVVGYLMGQTGPSLIANRLGATATRVDPAAVAAYIATNISAFDIDGDGNANALTDGILIVRYLFGIRGAALIRDVLSPNATRRTAAQVETYLGTLVR